MASYREIVTKAVIAKGKKLFTTNNTVKVDKSPSTILGCWVINHNFNGVKVFFIGVFRLLPAFYNPYKVLHFINIGIFYNIVGVS